MVQLIPDPGDFNWEFKRETFQLAKERTKDTKLNEADFEAARAEGQNDFKRFLLSLPEDKLISQLERSAEKLSDKQRADFLLYARHELENDPVAVDQLSMGSQAGQGQLMVMRGGTNLETALLISENTGSFLYTNQTGRWEEIIASREEMGETAVSFRQTCVTLDPVSW